MIIKISGDCILAPELKSLKDKIGFEGHIWLPGGGTAISRYLEGNGIKTEYKDGERVTPPEAIPIIREILTMQAEGVAHLFNEPKMGIVEGYELVTGKRREGYGEVGEPKSFGFMKGPWSFIMTPICRTDNWDILNVNGDRMARFLSEKTKMPIITVTLQGRTKDGEVVYCAK